MVESNEGLKRCPLCGKEVELISLPITFGDGRRTYHIECSCGLTTAQVKSKHSLIEYWNRRVKNE